MMRKKIFVCFQVIVFATSVFLMAVRPVDAVSQPANQSTNWWNQDLNRYWQADRDTPNQARDSWVSELAPSDFGTLPEVTPDFNWSDERYGEDYSGWYWYPEDGTENLNTEYFDYSGGAFGEPMSSSQSGTAPVAASVSGFVGYPQTYNLDCETRSAVDLAAFFGLSIDAFEFLTRLPKSDDPNEGFVGNYWDERGHLPPAGYGVYQEPIAALLRAYGLPAAGYKNYTWEQLKREIASGKPVMVWVAGNTEVGTAVPYTPSSGITTYVVPYQHTVVVTGYTQDTVTIQDGGQLYTRDLNTFLLSWQVLENRAIVVNY